MFWRRLPAHTALWNIAVGGRSRQPIALSRHSQSSFLAVDTARLAGALIYPFRLAVWLMRSASRKKISCCISDRCIRTNHLSCVDDLSLQASLGFCRPISGDVLSLLSNQPASCIQALEVDRLGCPRGMR